MFSDLFFFWLRWSLRFWFPRPPTPPPPRYTEDDDLLAVWRAHYGGNTDATTR